MLGLGTGKGGQSSNQQVQGQQMPSMGGGGLAALFANNAPASGGGGMPAPMPQIMAPQRPQIQMPVGRPRPMPQTAPMHDNWAHMSIRDKVTSDRGRWMQDLAQGRMNYEKLSPVEKSRLRSGGR